MKILHVLFFCCFSTACVEASAVMEVSGHVGGDVSIHCPGNWTPDNSSESYNMYFCKGVCSRENTVIQPMKKRLAVSRRGRYNMEVSEGGGAFSVTIKKLKRADAGRYHCGVGKMFNVLYQEVNLMVLNASTASPGSPPSTSSLQMEVETLPQGNWPFSTTPSPTTPPDAEENTNQQAATKLTNTTVAIIVSVSLALLVCAVIPLIFYQYCRSNPGDQNKPDANNVVAHCSEQNADVASTQAPVRL